MSDIKSKSQKPSPEFSFYPDSVTEAEDGTLKISRENPYVFMHSLTQGNLYYTPKTNEYWTSPKKRCPEDRFNEKYLPYLKWDYDKFEEVKTTSGAVKVVNTFPASPLNIEKKRKELIQAAIDAGEQIDYNALYNMTSPRGLKNRADVEAQLDNRTHEQRVLDRLKASGTL